MELDLLPCIRPSPGESKPLTDLWHSVDNLLSKLGERIGLCNASVSPWNQKEALGLYGQTVRPIYGRSGDPNSLTCQSTDTYDALRHPSLFGPVKRNPAQTQTYSLQSTSMFPPLLLPPKSRLFQAPPLRHKPLLAKHHLTGMSSVIGIVIFALLPVSDSIWITFSDSTRLSFPIRFDSHCTYFIFYSSHRIRFPFESHPREFHIV